MKNFEKHSTKSYSKTVKTTISYQGIEITESETYDEIEIINPQSKSSKTNLKSVPTFFNKMLKFILTSEGLISFFSYFKEPLFINVLLLIKVSFMQLINMFN